MSRKVNRDAYEKLIAQDRAWLAARPRTLERDHIDAVLAGSPEREYEQVELRERMAAVLRRLVAAVDRYRAAMQRRLAAMEAIEDAKRRPALIAPYLGSIAAAEREWHDATDELHQATEAAVRATPAVSPRRDED